MEVQRLKASEGVRLRSIRLRALQDAPDAFGSTFEETSARPVESWSEQLRQLPTFVAVLEQQDVGLVRGDLDKDDSCTAWLISMWVAPEARGHGVGDALIERVVNWARSAGAHRMLLDVGDENAHAIALYARMGFKPNTVVSTLPPPREHILEHQRELKLK